MPLESVITADESMILFFDSAERFIVRVSFIPSPLGEKDFSLSVADTGNTLLSILIPVRSIVLLFPARSVAERL